MMFPEKSGGISVYANEAWRKYTTFVGPLAAFGYWIGWSVVLSIFGKSDRRPGPGPLVPPHHLHGLRRHRPPDAGELHRDRRDHRRVDVQHLRRPPVQGVHVRDRRPADDRADRVHHPAVRDRRLALRATSTQRSPGRGAAPRRRSSTCSSSPGRRGRQRCARRSRPSTRPNRTPRSRCGARRRSWSACSRCCRSRSAASPDRYRPPPRRASSTRGRVREDRRQHGRDLLPDLPAREPGAVDVHLDSRRRPRAVRDLPGRHDGQAARRAQPLPRPRPRDDRRPGRERGCWCCSSRATWRSCT